MTLKEALKLSSSRELDELVAELAHLPVTETIPLGEQGAGEQRIIPYSCCIECAWELLAGNKSWFCVTRGLSSRAGEDFRLCRGYPNTGVYWLEYMTPSGLKQGPKAECASLAICRAALEYLWKKD